MREYRPVLAACVTRRPRAITFPGCQRAASHDTLVLMPADVTLRASDGIELAATLFEGDATQGRALIIAPATGVRREFYAPLATFLSTAGFHVLTFDWRGIGGSRAGSLRGFDASMTLWGTRDLPAAIDYAATRWPNARLHALGHSFGGQSLGLAPDARRLSSAVTVAAQSGYYGHWPRPSRYKYALLWRALMPGITRLAGYFPSRRMGLGEDLPAGVALEWARWCRTPDYLGDYSGHRRFVAPLLAYSFADDDYAPRGAVEWLHGKYGTKELEHRHLEPRALGAKRIGHFGFFRAGDATAPLWRQTVEWLRAR
jgi:predicted alpha/beta hydrolase